jgi:hypothetical protein
MKFQAETLRLTPLDNHRYLIGRDSLTLTGRQVVLTTGHETKHAVIARWGDICCEDQPEAWETLDVDIAAVRPDTYALSDVLGAVTRTGVTALEAWGPYDEQSGRWPYFVTPAVDFETQGACVAGRRDGVDFAGRLFEEIWGLYAEPGYEPRDSDGRRRQFTPVLAPKDGATWGIFETDTPPPTPSSDAVWNRLLDSDWFRNLRLAQSA